MRLTLPLLLAACSGAEALPEGVTVRTVTPGGDPLDVERVVWFDATDVPFDLDDAPALECRTGATCDERLLDEALPDRIHVVAALTQPDRAPPTGDGDETCAWWDSTFTVVHRADEGQLVHIVLDPERAWCDDGIAAGFVEPWVPPTVHADDVRVDLGIPLGRVVVRGQDPEGHALPLSGARWYFHPEGPDYDGEHALTCADALCTTWTLPDGEGPESADLFVNGTYDGPFHPWGDAHLGDYGGAPVTVGGEPDEVVLSLLTDLASTEDHVDPG